MSDTNPLGSSEKALVMLMVIVILRLQLKHYIPEAAIECLLKFLHSLFVLIGKFSDIGSSIAQHMPKSVYSLKKFAGITDHFEKLVVCSKCNSVYKMNDCVQKTSLQRLYNFHNLCEEWRSRTIKSGALGDIYGENFNMFQEDHSWPLSLT